MNWNEGEDGQNVNIYISLIVGGMKEAEMEGETIYSIQSLHHQCTSFQISTQDKFNASIGFGASMQIEPKTNTSKLDLTA